MVSLSENTQNVKPTKGASLSIQAEISKKRTNFGVFATANAALAMCMNGNSAARKSIAKLNSAHSTKMLKRFAGLQYWERTLA